MNKIRKHVNCTDVAAEFLRVIKVPDGYKVKLSWINIVNPDNVYRIGITEEVLITNEQMPNWKFYDEII